MRVTWNDREVRNPILRLVVGSIAAIGGSLGALLAVIMLAVFVPLSFPFHVVAQLLGGRGFMRDGTYSVPWWCCLLILGFILGVLVM